MDWIGVQTSKLIGSEIPREIYLALSKESIIEVTEEEFLKIQPTTREQIQDITKAKKKLKAFAASALLEKYKNPQIVAEILNEDFILMNETAMALSAALKMEQNIIFCGRGGYGKSEMIKKLFSNELLKEKVFIKSLNESTAEEDLFGGVKMKEFTETGEMLYKTDSSFINYEIAVFEEMLDADISVLSALKDALSSKEVRNGVQREKLKTKIVIGLTNKRPEDVVSNNSTEALIQRFPIIQEMEYPITKDVVALMILRSMKNPEIITLEDILKNEILTPSKILTPRKIMQIIKFIDSQIEITGGLTMVADISAAKITETKKVLKENLNVRKKKFIDDFKAEMERVKAKNLPTKEQMLRYDKIISTWRP